MLNSFVDLIYWLLHSLPPFLQLVVAVLGLWSLASWVGTLLFWGAGFLWVLLHPRGPSKES